MNFAKLIEGGSACYPRNTVRIYAYAKIKENPQSLHGKYSRLRLHHFIITFKPEYKGNFTLFSKLMEEICNHIGRVYQIVAALHEDTQHPHIYFVFNAVSFVNGYKYHGGKENYYELIEMIASILSAHKIYPLVPVKYIPELNNPHE